MSDWPVGLSTGCFYQRSIFDCLECIIASGFSLIEVCSSPAHLDYHDFAAVKRCAAHLEALGISAYSFHAPFADHIDITAPDPDRRAHSVREVLTAAEAAALLGSRYFVIHPGPEHSPPASGEERQSRQENVTHSLDRISLRCRELGMTCVLENKLPHLLFGNTGDLLWILKTMTVRDVGVCLDTGHARLGQELESATHQLATHLRMIHASDNRGHGDDHLPPGEGTIDWARVCALLRANDFRGSLIMEIAGRGEISEILASARRARHYLRRVLWRLS